MWNAITTFTQSLFHRAVTHKALLFIHTISGYANTIQHISMLATYKDKYSRLLQVYLLWCRAILWALHRATNRTLPFSGFRLLHIVLPRKAKHCTKACAWNNNLFHCSFKQATLLREACQEISLFNFRRALRRFERPAIALCEKPTLLRGACQLLFSLFKNLFVASSGALSGLAHYVRKMLTLYNCSLD